MSETKDAVDRLRWLCIEAARRAAEEKGDDFTRGLRPIETQFDPLMELLLAGRVLSWGGKNLQWPKNLQTIHRYRPFAVRDFEGPFVDGDGKVYDTGFVGEGRIDLIEPVGMGTGRSHHLYFETWEDEGKRWRKRDWVGHIAEIRKEFIQHCERWVRFLEAESAKLQTAISVEMAKGKTAKSKVRKPPGRERLIVPLELRKRIRGMKEEGRTVDEIQKWLREEKNIKASNKTIYAELLKDD